MPTAVSGNNKRLTAAGSATSEGMLTLSGDGYYLIVPGYDADTGTANVSATAASSTNRVIGRVDAYGNVDTATALTSTIGNPRGATSTDGSAMWLSSSGTGVEYATFGTSGSATQILASPANVRRVSVINGQLYISSASGSFVGVSSVGTGTPTTSGQTATTIIATGDR